MAIVTTHVAAVQQMYVAYFGRPADTAGLDYWTNVVEANAGATAAVSAAFAASPEYIVTYFGQTNTQIVNNVYQNLFGRDADVAGRTYWANLLTNGTIKVDTIVAEVAKAALTTDKEAVENKVAASTAFTAALDTTAENAGYAGNSALTLAKAFVKTVTTDATLATAIAPANLTAQVAAVVKAGTPFTLSSGLAAVEAADDNLDTFLDENEFASATAAGTAITTAETAAIAAIDAEVTGTYTGATASVQAALIADQRTANTKALSDANKALVTANADAAAITGLSAAIANQRAAVAANEAAIELAAETQVELDVAASGLNTRVGGTLDIQLAAAPAAGAAAVPVVTFVDGATTVNLISINAAGNFVLATGATEVKYPGVTALRDALAADVDADVDAGFAAADLTDANADPLLAANADEVTAVSDAFDDIEAANTNIEELADAVADLAEARALKTELAALNKAVVDAGAAFEAAGFAAPVMLDGPSAAATSASDVFLLGDEMAVTISAFGRSGSDALVIGEGYVVNSGALTTGNNAALEVFFIQNGTRTEVHVETEAFGSASDDVTVITLIGVDATDLQLVDGIISLKAGA
ncbi:hypothetical protein RCH14_003758 [Massilia sp. MP_M2]|uniref:DUF4214 domain-containing protein n=1 Tax=Massilia sp. MP_M2 TaxID=3071713 RepID=UPI00319D897B